MISFRNRQPTLGPLGRTGSSCPTVVIARQMRRRVESVLILAHRTSRLRLGQRQGGSAERRKARRRPPSAGNEPRCPAAYPRMGAAPAAFHRQMCGRGKAVAYELAEIVRRVMGMHIADHYDASESREFAVLAGTLKQPPRRSRAAWCAALSGDGRHAQASDTGGDVGCDRNRSRLCAMRRGHR